MQEIFKILRGGAVSDMAKNDDKSVSIEIPSSTGHLYESDFKTVVDLNEQFQKERDACSDYRVILTINPYCTNVLFNPCTEIVRNEGSPEVEVVSSFESARLSASDKAKIKGKVTSVYPYDMVRNTEYSKESVGYEYHPGKDIFNNHVIRNKTFRIVNRMKQPNPPLSARKVFNTIDDYMRSSNGDNIMKCCRLAVSDTSFRKKHLYDMDDILSFANGEAIGENLSDTDGWFGFVNQSVIPSKDADGTDMDISRTLNNRGGCEFVDMYPDRTLFSVVPKYNKFRNRLEYNWEYTLTYPFDSTRTYDVEGSGGTVEHKDFLVISDGQCNAVAVLDAQYVMLPNSKNAILFRSAVRHNLKSGDKVTVYFNIEDGYGQWVEIKNPVSVNGTGDLQNNHHDFYFYTTDTSILEQVFIPSVMAPQTTKWDYVKAYFYNPLNLNNIDTVNPEKRYYPGNLVNNGGTVYMCKAESVGFTPGNYVDFNTVDIPEYEDGVEHIPYETDAYVKVGNHLYELYNHDVEVPYHVSAYDANRFIRQTVNNAFRDNDNPVGNSGSAQSSPLWTDYIQFRFAKTDGVRKSEYYVRKFKKIPNIKYGQSGLEPLVDAPFDDEYYKLAFAKTAYGDEIAQSVVMDNVKTKGLTDNLGRPVSEIFLSVFKTNKGNREWYYGEGEGPGDKNVEFSHCFGPVTCGFDIFGTCDDTSAIKDKRLEMNDVHMICNDVGYDEKTRTLLPWNDISVDNDWFYGDIVEFCPWTCEETVLSDVCFRFNTAQREYRHEEGEQGRFQFSFDEIKRDDYDDGGFSTVQYTVDNGNYKKEGYFYKPHHRIRLKGFGKVNQASHRAVIIDKAVPVQMDGIFIKVSTVTAHGMSGGERVRLRDRVDVSKEWWLDVVSVPDDFTFVMDRVHHGNGLYVNWMDICSALNSGTMTIEIKNVGIPEYAKRVSPNTYLWRDVTNPWDIDNLTEDVEEFPFANGCFYIDKAFNLFVRRQDPYGCNRLYEGGAKAATGVSDGHEVEIETECLSDIVSVLPDESAEIYKDDSFAIC